MVIENKIVKILTEIKIDNAEKVLAKVLLDRVDNTNNNINSIDINKIIIDINKIVNDRYLLKINIKIPNSGFF